MSNGPRIQLLPALLAAATAVGGLFALMGTLLRQQWLPAALWHTAFAMGALPLILAAMAYFVPVLTRTAPAPRSLLLPPLVALVAGLGIVGWFVDGVDELRYGAPWLALAAVAGLAYWISLRWRACLGRPHPGLYWYAAALACLGLGLAAVGISALLPDEGYGLRLFHLHINTLGFMGLTAIGTLQVLLPTVLGRPDPAAGDRLTRDIGWGLAGALGIALGAAWWWPLAALAALAYLWPLLHLLIDAWRAFGRNLFAPRQAAPLLLAAMAGLIGTLVHGVAHGVDLIRARDVLPLFLIGFLLPLVSGAVTQLLPVWLRPGAQADRHRIARQRLALLARSRAALLLVGGIVAGLGQVAGYGLGALSALWLVAAMLVAAVRR